MKLYHFTRFANWTKIKADPKGIWRGVIPHLAPGEFKPRPIVGFQWLTLTPEFEAQDWDVFLPDGLRATDYRLEIDFHHLGLTGGSVYSRIAGRQVGELFRWSDLARHVHSEFAALCNGFPSSRHWYVYRGRIPLQWVIGHKPNPTPIDPVLN